MTLILYAMPGLIAEIFKGGLSGILSGVSEVIDTVTTTKEEKAAIQERVAKVVNDHVERMATLSAQAELQLLQDVADARKMNIEAIKSDDKFVRRFTYYLAAAVIVAGFGLFALLLTGDIPTESKDIAYVILGSLGGAITTVLAFFFGSTRGSDHKNETIKNLTRGGTDT